MRQAGANHTWRHGGSCQAIIEAAFGFKQLTRSSDTFDRVDFRLANSDTLVAIEIKTRKIKSSDFDDSIIRDTKVQALRSLVAEGWRVLLILNYTDRLLFIELTGTEQWRWTANSGRPRRPHFHIPIKSFHPVPLSPPGAVLAAAGGSSVALQPRGHGANHIMALAAANRPSQKLGAFAGRR